jgi:hypothetical protein
MNGSLARVGEYGSKRFLGKQALRRARQEEMDALIRKCQSAVDLEYQTALARLKKV